VSNAPLSSSLGCGVFSLFGSPPCAFFSLLSFGLAIFFSEGSEVPLPAAGRTALSRKKELR